MISELSANDLLVLEKLRLDRLRSHFPTILNACFIQLTPHNHLSIHCSEPWIVDHLLLEIDQLRWAAKTIVGAQHVSICFAQEEIYRTVTQMRYHRPTRSQKTHGHRV